MDLMRYNKHMDERKAKLAQLLKIEDKRARIAQIQTDMQSGDFWSDHVTASRLTQELSQLSDIVDTFDLSESDAEIQKLEKDLAGAQKQLAQVKEQLLDEKLYQENDTSVYTALLKEQEYLAEQVDSLESRWLALMQQLDS